MRDNRTQLVKGAIRTLIRRAKRVGGYKNKSLGENKKIEDGGGTINKNISRKKCGATTPKPHLSPMGG